MAKTSKALLAYVDMDNKAVGGVATKHGVQAMPTLVYIKGGVEADRMQGVDESKLASWVSASA